MSITKNPIFLALIASTLVFAVTFYYYNYLNKPVEKKTKHGKKTKSDKQKSAIVINETIVLSTAIVGLLTWYIATNYVSSSKEGEESVVNSVVDVSKAPDAKGETGTRNEKIEINSSDPTRSYNMIGSGLNIPRSELKIPSVLIDYQ